jgi:signal transduction histidine kinase
MKITLPVKINFNLKLLILAMFLIAATIFLLVENLSQIKKSQLQASLSKEAVAIESILSEKFNSTFLVIEMMGREVVKGPQNKHYIKKVLEKYKSDKSLNQIFSWTIFSWADQTSQITVDGKYGILQDHIDLSGRDYIPEARSRPWQLLLGKPVYGSTSKKWMIPGGAAITDRNRNFLGTIAIGFEIDDLTKFVQKELEDENINVELIYKGRVPVFNVSKSSIKIFSKEEVANFDHKAHSSQNSKTIQLKHSLESYPYDLVLTYDKKAVSAILWEVIYSRLLEILIAVVLSLTLLAIIYKSEKEKREKIHFLMQKELMTRQSKSEFMIRIGHELKNFVTAIVSLSDLIQNDLKSKKSLDGQDVNKELDHLTHIDDISEELMKFITDLVDINKPEDGKFEINKLTKETDLEDMLDRSLMILKSKIKNKQIAINTSVDHDLQGISNLDPRRIKQILVSIIGNAVKYSDNESGVDIAIRNSSEKGVKISIKDYGDGMSKSEIESSLISYNPNKNMDEYENNSIELELPIVKFLIEGQGGIMEIYSTHKKGTEVKISF